MLYKMDSSTLDAGDNNSFPENAPLLSINSTRTGDIQTKKRPKDKDPREIVVRIK